MKNIAYIFIVAIVILLAWLCIPKSCEPSGKSEQFNRKSDVSLIIDSLQKIETANIRKESELLLKVYKDSLATIKESREKLSVNYYALRAKIKHLQTVKVDSSGQTVNVPVIEYNASINSGTMCDSLLMYQDQELAIKDSIISVKDIVIITLEKNSATTDQALADLLLLNNEEKKQKEKAKRLNKNIPQIAIISGLIGSVLTLFILR